MKNTVYIISFGNSTKYRFTPDVESLSEISGDIKSYLAKKYPDLAAAPYYGKMNVTEVDASNEREYKGYKEFDSNSVEEIKKVLSREIENAASVHELNSNAPWGN